MADKEKQKAIQEFLNRKRKLDLKVAENPSTSSDQKPPKTETKSEEMEQKTEGNEQYEKAKQALLFDAKRAKERAESDGPQGYLKPKSLVTNKNFLRRTIESTLPRKSDNPK